MAALNAIADAGLKLGDIDGIATAGEDPVFLAQCPGVVPRRLGGTHVGGCSFMIHVRHAVAAIKLGLCSSVLITHRERREVEESSTVVSVAACPTSWAAQFEAPFGTLGAPTIFAIPVLRYLNTLLQNVMLAVQAHRGHSFGFWSATASDEVLLKPA